MFAAWLAINESGWESVTHLFLIHFDSHYCVYEVCSNPKGIELDYAIGVATTVSGATTGKRHTVNLAFDTSWMARAQLWIAVDLTIAATILARYREYRDTPPSHQAQFFLLPTSVSQKCSTLLYSIKFIGTVCKSSNYSSPNRRRKSRLDRHTSPPRGGLHSIFLQVYTTS